MSQMNGQVEALARMWEADARWEGIERAYGPEQVVRLRGSILVERMTIAGQ